MNKTLIVVLAVLVGAAIVGGYFFPEYRGSFGSPSGTTLTTGKVAEQVITTGTTTTFAILNSDASDRTITGVDILLKNATATSTTYGVACATSTSASSLQSNTNYILNTSLATSTFGSIIGAGTFVATSSPGLTGTSTASAFASVANPYVRNWAAGTQLVCQVTTADGYNAFNSTTNGFISFSYRGQ